MADLVTRKLNLVLLGKTLPSLIIGDCLLGSGIKFLILDLEDDKPSSPIENQYLWVDIQNHELTTRFIRSYTTPGFPKRPYPESAKSSVMLDQLGFTWFRHRYYINYLQLWKTFDCNDVFRKLGNLCDKMDCAENVFGVKWNQFETELDNVTVLEYLRKNCYLSSTVAWFKELASWFMNCDVSKLSMFWFVWCLKLSGGVETLMNSNQVLVKTETLFMKLLQKLESHIALCKNTDKSTGSFVPVTFAGDKIEMKLADYSQIETSFVFSFLDVKRTANIVKFDKTCYEDTHKLRIFLEMLFHEPKIDLEVPLMGNVSLIEAATSVFCHNNLGFARSCHRLFPFSELSVFSMRTSFYGKDAIHFFSRCIDQSNVVSYLNAILTKVGLRVDGTDIKRSQIYLHAPMPSTGLVSSGLISEKDLRRFDRLLILDQLFLTKYPNHIEGVILMALQKLRKYFPDCEISHDCVAIGDSSEVARRKTDIEMETSSTEAYLTTQNLFNVLPSVTLTITAISLYLLFCCYRQFGDELKEIAALLYVYYRFDATRDQLLAPKSTRFQRFAKFFQIQPIVTGVNRIYGLAGNNALYRNEKQWSSELPHSQTEGGGHADNMWS